MINRLIKSSVNAKFLEVFVAPNVAFVVFIEPPFCEIVSVTATHFIVRLIAFFVKFFTQIAKRFRGVEFVFEIFFPLKIFEIEGVVVVQQFDVFGDFGWRLEIGHVDVRMCWSEFRVISAAVHDRNNIFVEVLIKSFSDQISGKDDLGRQVKFVLFQ